MRAAEVRSGLEAESSREWISDAIKMPVTSAYFAPGRDTALRRKRASGAALQHYPLDLTERASRSCRPVRRAPLSRAPEQLDHAIVHYWH